MGTREKLILRWQPQIIFFTYRLVLRIYKWFVATCKRESAIRGVSTAIITVLRARMGRANRLCHPRFTCLSYSTYFASCDLLCCYSLLSEGRKKTFFTSIQDKKWISTWDYLIPASLRYFAKWPTCIFII